MIEVSNLVKKYGDHTAVDHLSFQIEKGKIYGFLGPNGAGKSTTMNMITGYIASTEGKVMIDGHDILEEPEAAKKCIGYLPEMPPLYFDMTVLEYMKFAADLKKIPRNQKDKQIKEVMDMVKITDMKDRLIKNLSKGYRQRVGLAQAILGYPEVIILDEPTVGLDPKQIIEIRDLIKSLKQKHTVILSSHILSEVRAVCDYVLIISHGKLVASDTPDNLERLAAGSNSLLMKVKRRERYHPKRSGNDRRRYRGGNVLRQRRRTVENKTFHSGKCGYPRKSLSMLWQKQTARSTRCRLREFLLRMYSLSLPKEKKKSTGNRKDHSGNR